MLFTPVNLEFQIANDKNHPANLDLIAMQGKVTSLAVAACVEWADSTSPDDEIRREFREGLLSRIRTLTDGDSFEAHKEKHKLVLDQAYMFRANKQLPTGFMGLSLLVADNGNTPGTLRPHVMFTNYVGSTATYIKNHTEDFLNPRTSFTQNLAGLNGLFAVTEEDVVQYNGNTKTRTLAEMRTLGFDDGTSWSAYVGQKTAIQTLACRSATSTEPLPPGIVAICAVPVTRLS